MSKSSALQAALQPTAMPIAWLWQPRIPLGKITLLAGDPGLGKSFIALDLAARVSNASPMPHAVPASPGQTPPNRLAASDSATLAPVPDPATDHSPPSSPAISLLLCAEDEYHDTIVPRLAAHHADLARIFPLRSLNAQRDASPAFSLRTHLKALRAFLEKSQARLLILDPITAFMEGIDLNSTSHVRQYLTPLAQLVAHTRTAVLAITHLNKQSSPQNLYRATGSLALAAIARSVLLVHPAPGGNYNLLTQIKSNLAAPAPALPFRIADNQVEWLQPPAFTSRPTDCPPSSTQDPGLKTQDQPPADFYESHDRQVALDFLRESLAQRPQPAIPLIRQAKSLAISERTLRRAKAHLGILSKHNDRHGDWYWLFPHQSLPDNGIAPEFPPAS